MESSGIGLELVKEVLKSKHFVVVSSRNSQKNEELINLKNKYNENLKLLNLDVTNEENIKNKIDEAWKFF